MRNLPPRSVLAFSPRVASLLLLGCIELACSLPPELETGLERLVAQRQWPGTAQRKPLESGGVGALSVGSLWSPTGSLATARTGTTATRLPSGKVLVAGGIGSGSPLASAEVYDPDTGLWSPTGSLATARTGTSATLLPSGKVLVSGGFSSGSPLASAEVYDPDTGLWSPTGSLNTARAVPTATRLPSGKVLLFGGMDTNGVLASAEVYDPDTELWSPTGSLNTARAGHTTTLLPSGKVLVSGGANSGVTLASAEVYDPDTGLWSPTGSLNAARASHRATLLPSGKVLVSGGSDSNNFLASAEVYDPDTGLWSPTGSLNTARAGHTTTLLPSGKVLVSGGGYPDGYLASAELYAPDTEVWSPAGSMATARAGNHTATLLPSGKVLVCGGVGSGNAPLASAEVYGPPEGISTPTASLAEARTEAMTVLLPSGQVLVAGGAGSSGPLASAQLYDTATGRWTSTQGLGTARASASATLLLTGEVLVAGGKGSSGLRALGSDKALPSAELFDPRTHTWRTTGSLLQPRHSHSALLLSTGRVLVTGGTGDDGTALATAEVYDPATGSWSATGSMRTARRQPLVVPLPTGQVLVAGGLDSQGHSLSSAEVYDPRVGTWVETAPMSTARAASTAVLLASGQVLVAGGTQDGQALSTAEVYDPRKAQWKQVAPLNTARKSHAAQLLPTGSALVLGGSNGSTPLNHVEVYDPVQETWQVKARLTTPRAGSMTVLLPTGQVLVIAGQGASGPLNKTELYDEVGDSNTPRPVVDPLTSQRPKASLVVQGRQLRASEGIPPVVRVLASPAGAMWDVEATEFSDTSVRVTLPDAPDGYHLLFVLAHDVAGGRVVHIDGTPPGAPSITAPAAFVNTRTPVLGGTSEPGSTVTVSVDGQVAGTAKASVTGDWSFPLATALDEGSHSLEATAADAVGNVSLASPARTFTLDLLPPAAPELTAPGTLLNTPRPLLAGTAEPGSTVTVSVDGHGETTLADSTGHWSLTPSTALKDGAHTATATAMDQAGNTGAASAARAFTVDTQAPEAPLVLELQQEARVDSHALVLRGIAEPGSTVTVSVDGQVAGTALADRTGAWESSLPTPLEPGEYTASATARDAAGNTSLASEAHSFTVGARDSGCAAGPGEPSLVLLGLMALGRLLSRRRELTRQPSR